jgi:hydrogenase assembly chaperone HypC/HupF
MRHEEAMSMCQTIPGRVILVQGDQAEVETDGYTGWFTIATQPTVQKDDYVLTHADLVLSVISEAEARRLTELNREARQSGDPGGSGPGGMTP